jgi:hypothetical protein
MLISQHQTTIQEVEFEAWGNGDVVILVINPQAGNYGLHSLWDPECIVM